MHARARLAAIGLTAAGVFGPIAGCVGILGIQSTGPPLLTGCNLPTDGNGRVRLVNVAAVGGNIDFCIRRSGTSDWGLPIFRDGGNDALCLGSSSRPGGLAYAQATVPFAVPAGKIDVKAIPSGETCAVKGASELDGVSVGDSVNGNAPVVTLMRYGGGSSEEAISALPEAVRSAVPTSDTAVRVVNALSGVRSIDWGFSSSARLPATVAPIVVPEPIAPGNATSPSSSHAPVVTTIDSAGYAEFLPFTLNIVAAYADDAANNGITLYTLPSGADLATFYVIGDPNDATKLHPVTGLYCEDAKSLAPTDTDGAAPGDAADALPSQDTGLLAQCTLAQLQVLSVDLVDVSLYGASAPFAAQRRPYVYAEIAARTSDLMCIVDAADLGDRMNIADAGKAANAQGTGRFQYSFMVTTDSSTPPSNAADVKPAPANPPCGANVVGQTYVNQAYACVEQNCSTQSGGDPQGMGALNGTLQCLSAACALQLAPLYTPITPTTTPRQLANDYCFNCAIYYFIDETPLAIGESKCTTQSAPAFNFEGQTPSMILSHYPITSTASYNLPATGFRRAVLKAQVKLEDRTIDFFCGQLQDPTNSPSLPYTGSYGSDIAPDGGLGNGWEEEQDLQAKEALAWIKQQIALDGLAAVIAIDLHSTDARVALHGELMSLSPEVIDLFDAPTSTFAPAVVPNATPFCDYCPSPQNPYSGNTPPYELLHAYLSGFPENATRTETLWGADSSEVPIPSNLPYQPAPPHGTGPPLQYYAHNYTILRP